MARSILAACMVLAEAIAGQGKVQPAPAAAELRLVRSGGVLDPWLRGVWHDPGNAWILDLTKPEPVLYNETKVDCLRDPVTAPLIYDYIATYWTGDERSIGLTARPDIPLTHFRRIEGVPEKCHNPPAPTPTNVFNSLVANFSEHYPDFRVRGVDWDRSVAEARAKLRDDMGDGELFALLVSVIAPLGDSHVTLEDPKNEGRYFEEGSGKTLAAWDRDPGVPGYPDRRKVRQEFGKRWASSVEQDLLGGSGTKVANGRLFHGRVSADIAYLAPTAFYGTSEGLDWREEGEAYARLLDQAFASFAGAKALIIDLSNHRGGSPDLGQDITSRVAHVPVVGARIRQAHPAGQPSADWGMTPKRDRPRFDGPVYVLVSDITVSGGEFVTLLLRRLPNVLVVGERTRGSLSSLIDKTLPNGWKLELPNQVMLTPEGEDFAAVGIPPEIALPVYGRGPDPHSSHRLAVRELVDHIRACRPRGLGKPCW